MVDVPRYEINRQVRVVLNRHDIDLTRIDYSFTGGTVYLYGELLKNGQGDLVPTMIESLMKDIAGLSGVRDLQADLQNWLICAAGGAWQITKSKRRLQTGGQQGGTAEGDKDVKIETSEKIADVLQDMQEKSEQKQ